MKILKAEIDWMKQWGNLPNLVLTVDKVPERSRDTRFKRAMGLEGTTMYWAIVEEPLVQFFAHMSGNENGYSGARFSGTLEDGTLFEVRGPWSSNAMAMNEYFPATCAVTLKDSNNTAFAGFHIFASAFVHYVREAGGDITMISGYGDDSETEILPATLALLKESPDAIIGPYDFAIKLPGMTLAQSQQRKNHLV